ncbi:MAG: phospholipase A [Tannerella sp.]|jgi:phospholipase A1|nr:phospholipase A [Tannerella sp.]
MYKLICFFFFLSVSLSLPAQKPDRAYSKEERKAIRLERRDSLMTRLRERIDDFGPDYNADSVRRELESGPHFSLFKDNYFMGGVPLGQKVKAGNSNVKFQLSISHRLTKSVLPFDTYLFLHYSQKTVWNVFEESLPVRDMNFNPGIGIGHLIIHENRYIGKTIFMLEHESNGKDSLSSRSWNKVSLGINLMLNNNFDAQLKLWAPIVDSDNNRDILRYNGIGHFGLNYCNSDKRFHAGLLTTWRTESFSFNTQWEFSFKLNKKENQYLFIQYYNGYGENLLDYNRYKSIFRMGFVIKPRDFTIY